MRVLWPPHHPPLVAGIEASFIEAIGKLKDRLLILLNMDRILGLDEVAATKEVTARAAQEGVGVSQDWSELHYDVLKK